jgi:hypothetical protein
LVEFHSAGFRHVQTVPEDQEQQAMVAGFVPAVLHSFNQPFNLAAGEVLALGYRSRPRLVFLLLRPFINFVESFSGRIARKPA